MQKQTKKCIQIMFTILIEELKENNKCKQTWTKRQMWTRKVYKQYQNCKITN